MAMAGVAPVFLGPGRVGALQWQEIHSARPSLGASAGCRQAIQLPQHGHSVPFVAIRRRHVPRHQLGSHLAGGQASASRLGEDRRDLAGALGGLSAVGRGQALSATAAELDAARLAKSNRFHQTVRR